ncbi:hypothetical protein YC2023_085204 [Brassica napus]
MGGMAICIPKIFTMFTILLMASLALPGMSVDPTLRNVMTRRAIDNNDPHNGAP